MAFLTVLPSGWVFVLVEDDLGTHQYTRDPVDFLEMPVPYTERVPQPEFDVSPLCCVSPQNSVTFSGDRMEEASVVRARLQRFVALADARVRAARKDRPPGTAALRWGEKEKWLVEETSNCRR